MQSNVQRKSDDIFLPFPSPTPFRDKLLIWSWLTWNYMFFSLKLCFSTSLESHSHPVKKKGELLHYFQPHLF